MEVPLNSKLLVTWITRLSPQSAMIVGPGTVPLKVRAKREYPSGDTVVFSTESQYYFFALEELYHCPTFCGQFCVLEEGNYYQK
jgi:hypothetical protein